ncbi:MAG TPA: AraC family transcriptional regulator [Acidobacteriota bacterium]|nr:AraC family transcriptional regulator [Acidobacteriota bacterium]
MDVLSEVLKTVKLEGALYYNAEFSEPWSIRAPSSSVMAPHLAPGAGHVIIFHLLIEGKAYAGLEDGAMTSLEAGDIVIFPHGDPHIMGNGQPGRSIDAAKELERILSQGLKLSRIGGGGAVTRLICGYMACEPRLAQVFLSGLPPFFTVNIRNDTAGRWLENSILYSVGEANSSRAGGAAVLAKLSEVLFVETLRRYIAELPPDQTGWLAGARDEHVGKALALLHRQPAHSWTIAGLAEEVGVSRSVLAERFTQYLGEPPITYLMRWRLQLGAQKLSTTSWSVAQIALDVGYESEAAFNRAFKREFGSPPARFRTATKASRAAQR